MPSETTVAATVGIAPRSGVGFGITADLLAALPAVDSVEAQRLVKLAHQICSYSNATRDNADFGLKVA